jgi:hypothetical protein
MSFLNPLFLIAAISVAVPLLIYLLNIRKPKKVKFSTLAFFDSLKTTSMKRIKIKRWLLLLIRSLAIVALVIAASRPFLPPDIGWTSNNQPKIIGIVIDNSPSMNRVDRNGPYIDQAKELAGEILSLAGDNDRIVLEVTNGSPLSIPPIAVNAALNRIDRINTINSGSYTGERILSTSETLEDEREPNKVLYFISDAQQSQIEQMNAVDEQAEISGLQVLTVGSGTTVNIAVRDVEIEYGGINQPGNIQLRTVLQNGGQEIGRNQLFNIYKEGELIYQQSFDLEPSEQLETTYDVPVSGQDSIRLELEVEGDELSFDNRYYAAIQLPEEKQLIVLNEGERSGDFTSYLTPMLEIASQESGRISVEFTDVENLDVSSLFNYDAIVLDGVRRIPDYISQPIIDHVQSGAGLLLLPAADGNISSYNRLLSFGNSGRFADLLGSYGSFEAVDRMEQPSEGHPIINEMFDKPEEEEVRLNVPEIFYYYQIDRPEQSTSLPILETRTGNPLLLESRVGNGVMLISAVGSDPGWSNFPVKPFFAPLIYRTVDYLVRADAAVLSTHTLGQPFSASVGRAADTAELIKEGELIMPELRQTFGGGEVTYPALEWTPGWLELKTANSSWLFSVNQNAMESSLNSLSEQNLKETFETVFDEVIVVDAVSTADGVAGELETASFGHEVWFWFVIIAIILLLLESLLSRYYQAESIT